MQSHFNDDDDDIKNCTVTVGEELNANGYIQINANADNQWLTGNPFSDNQLTELEERFEEFQDDMIGRIENIEEQIVLVRRDNALEEQFEELKEAWDKYNEILDKLRTFKALQDSA
jgi:protease II